MDDASAMGKPVGLRHVPLPYNHARIRLQLYVRLSWTKVKIYFDTYHIHHDFIIPLNTIESDRTSFITHSFSTPVSNLRGSVL